MLALVHIGMMKAGSTWLHHWLNAHPELAAPFQTRDIAPGKNPYYWNRNHPYGRPPSKMGRPKMLPQEYKAAVESVPKAFDLTDAYSYMTDQEIAELRVNHPDVLVSYTIRDPIEAAWAHMLGHGMTIEDLVAGNKAGPRVLANAQVEQNLDRWRAAGFDMHLTWFEEIQEDPVGVLRGLASRLGIDPNWWDDRADEVRQKIHPRKRESTLTLATRRELARLIEEFRPHG